MNHSRNLTLDGSQMPLDALEIISLDWALLMIINVYDLYK